MVRANEPDRSRIVVEKTRIDSYTYKCLDQCGSVEFILKIV